MRLPLIGVMDQVQIFQSALANFYHIRKMHFDAINAGETKAFQRCESAHQVQLKRIFADYSLLSPLSL